MKVIIGKNPYDDFIVSIRDVCAGTDVNIRYDSAKHEFIQEIHEKGSATIPPVFLVIPKEIADDFFCEMGKACTDIVNAAATISKPHVLSIPTPTDPKVLEIQRLNGELERVTNDLLAMTERFDNSNNTVNHIAIKLAEK